MSVTFLVAGGPTLEKVEFGEPISVQALGEVNLGNCKAAAVLRLIDRSGEQDGCLEGEELTKAIEAATRALNGRAGVDAEVIERGVIRGAMRVREDGGIARIERGVTVHEMGLSHDALHEGLSRVLEVMVSARREGFPFCWG